MSGTIKFLNSNTSLGGRVAVGVSSLVGPTGAIGLQGPVGSGGGGTGGSGFQGFQGLIGVTGARGFQGLVGVTGSNGLQGLVGVTGTIGPQGLAGSGGGGSSQWISSTGGIIYYSSGSIGIGKANPTGSLDVVGLVSMTGTLNLTGNMNMIGNKNMTGGLNIAGNINMITGSLINPTFQNYKETVNLGISSSASYIINCNTGNNFNVTLAIGTTSFSFINVPATGTLENINLFLTQDNSGNRLATWPSSVSWGNPSTPVLSTAGNSTDIISFTTFTGGSKWFGFLAGRGF